MSILDTNLKFRSVRSKKLCVGINGVFIIINISIKMSSCPQYNDPSYFFQFGLIV